MQRKRSLETEEQRINRDAKEAQRRIEDAAAEEKAIDAMVRQSIRLNGA